MELVYQYVQAIQGVIHVGANVRMMVGNCSVGVLSVEVGDDWLEVEYITSASPAEQQMVVSLATQFLVTFDDWPQEVVQMGWSR